MTNESSSEFRPTFVRNEVGTRPFARGRFKVVDNVDGLSSDLESKYPQGLVVKRLVTGTPGETPPFLLHDGGPEFGLADALYRNENIFAALAGRAPSLVELQAQMKQDGQSVDDLTQERVHELKKLLTPGEIAKLYKGREELYDKVFMSVGLPNFVVKSDWVAGAGANGKGYVYCFQEKFSNYYPLGMPELWPQVTRLPGKTIVQKINEGAKHIAQDIQNRYSPEEAKQIKTQLSLYAEGVKKLRSEHGMILDIWGGRSPLITQDGNLKLFDVDAGIPRSAVEWMGEASYKNYQTEMNRYLVLVNKIARNLV